MASLIIDCDADPFVLEGEGWGVEQHQKVGRIAFDPSKVQFYLSAEQVIGSGIRGTALLNRLTNLPVLNANVLDCLLANPDLIPESWKRTRLGDTRHILFPGTVYSTSKCYPFVRELLWDSIDWTWSYSVLTNDCYGKDYTALYPF